MHQASPPSNPVPIPDAVLKSQHAAQAGISVVIPAFNEELGLPGVLTQLQAVMRTLSLPYEIIVVDDGSQDGTAVIAAQFAGITVLRHAHNRGYGAALKTGIRRAQYEWICITDADGTYPNDRIPELVEQAIEGNEHMVVGARQGANVAIPALRRPAKWVISHLANSISGENIPDINSGLRVFRRSVALRFFRVLSDAFSFTTTITLAMLTNGYRVRYTPIDYYVRMGKSKIRPIRDTLSFIQLILRIGLYFAPLKIFLSSSIFLLLLGIVWGVVSKIVFGQLADVTTLVILMTSFQVAGVGLLAELINHRIPYFWNDED